MSKPETTPSSPGTGPAGDPIANAAAALAAVGGLPNAQAVPTPPAPSATATPTAKPESASMTTPAAGEKGKEGTKTEAAKPDAPKVPFKIKLPELPPNAGLLGEKSVAKFEEIAEKSGVSLETAQQIVNEIAPAMLADQKAHHEALRQKASAKWLSEIEADPVIGGEHLARSKRATEAAIASRGPEQAERLTRLLVDSGLIDHPDMRRLLTAYGEQFLQDTIETGSAPIAPVDLNDPNTQIGVLMTHKGKN